VKRSDGSAAPGGGSQQNSIPNPTGFTQPMTNQNLNTGMMFSTNPNAPPYNQGQNAKATYPYPQQNPAVRPQVPINPHPYSNMPTSQSQYQTAANPMMYGNYNQPRGGQPYYQQNPSSQVPMVGNTYLQYPAMTNNPYPQSHPQSMPSSNQPSQQSQQKPPSDSHTASSNASSQAKQYQGNQVGQHGYSAASQHQFSAIGSTPINPTINYYHPGQTPIYTTGSAPNAYYQYVAQGRGPVNPTGASNQEKGVHSSALPNSGTNPPNAAYAYQQYSMNLPPNTTYQSNPSSYPYQNPAAAQQQYQQTIGGKIVDSSSTANSATPQQFVANSQSRPGYPSGYPPSGPPNQYYSQHAPVSSQQVQSNEKNAGPVSNSQAHSSAPPKNS
jgi:hypothetical protein